MGGNRQEERRLVEAQARTAHWKRWGPYLAERQWGTVREDYSPYGTAWDSFPHDQARSRAYRWGEDGLLGISDNHQRLCFALALWNGRDPILKERLFGLTNSEGNHGEDVKEYYYYLDSTPTHSYMKALYRYPQAAPRGVVGPANRDRGRARVARRDGPRRGRFARSALHAQRDEPPETLRRPEPFPLGQGRDRPLRRARREGRGQSRARGNEGGPALLEGARRGRDLGDQAPAVAPPACRRAARRGLRRSVRNAQGRGRR